MFDKDQNHGNQSRRVDKEYDAEPAWDWEGPNTFSGTAALAQRVLAWNEEVSDEGWSLRMPSGLMDRPALQRGLEQIRRGASIIVGMSLGNSYFSQERITRLFRFLEGLGVDIHIVVMDKPSEHNYRALGYTEQEITRKIKKKGTEILRAVNRALAALGNRDHFHLVDWDTIRGTAEYQLATEKLTQLYQRDPHFREDLKSTIDAYIGTKLKDSSSTKARSVIAEKYLLEELSFLISSPVILKEENLTYLYHKEWPIFERLVVGHYNQSPEERLGFIEMKVD